MRVSTLVLSTSIIPIATALNISPFHNIEKKDILADAASAAGGAAAAVTSGAVGAANTKP